MQLFTLEDWINSIGIHKKIENSLREIDIKYLFGKEDPSLQTRSFAEYYGFREKPKESKQDASEFLFFLVGNWMKINNFNELLKKIKDPTYYSAKKVLLLNGKRNELYHHFPKDLRIFHKFKENYIIPKRKSYKKSTSYEKLKELFSKIPQLPLQPLKIYGYGSFFRDKELIGDIDLNFELDYEDPKWNDFSNFFTDNDKNLYEFQEIIIDESISGKNLRVSFFDKCQEPDFQKRIEKFNLNLNILQYCRWNELIRGNIMGMFLPSLKILFLRMFSKGKKGISAHSLSKGEKAGKNYILLWSRDHPSFEDNYKKWEEFNKEDYIRKDYLDSISVLDKWIEAFREVTTPYQIDDKTRDYALKQLEDLKNKYPPIIKLSDTYKSLSDKINDLRENTKKIIEQGNIKT